jgi:hypothetical protein
MRSKGEDRMEEFNNTEINNAESTPRGSAGKWIAAGVAVALAGGNIFLMSKTSAMEDEMSKLRDGIRSELTVVQDRGAASDRATRESIDALVAELRETRDHAGKAAASARSIAQKHAEKLVSTMEAREHARAEAIAAKLGEVQQSIEAGDVKIAEQLTEVKTDVGNVRGTVEKTRTELDATIADLKSVRGDLGVQSGLIATNAKELAALRELGERNYYEFDIAKSKGNTKVGSVVVALKKADLKRNRFTIELVADDRRVEKKDKTVNEPVQFYVSGGRMPYELVVNQVHKDRIVGYLAAPKVMQASR